LLSSDDGFCATGATALRTVMMSIKAGESDVGMAVGVEKLAGAGLLGVAPSRQAGGTWEPSGRVGAIMDLEGRVGTDGMPGTFAQVGMEYAHSTAACCPSCSPASARRTTATRR